jgi:hypothetical protein
MHMELERPKPHQRTHIQAIDGTTRKSKTITVYGVTPVEVIEKVKELCKSKGKRQPAAQSA